MAYDEGSGVFSVKAEPGGDEIRLAFSKWASLIKFSDVSDDIIRLWKRHELRHFNTQGAQTGPRWRALSPKYEAWKQANFPGRPILVRTGALRDALSKGGQGSGIKKRTHSLTLGLDVSTEVGKYGEAHQFGDGVPARPPIRYDTTVQKIGKIDRIGTNVPLGTAIAQLFMAHIVRARKEAHADKYFAKQYDFARMRRGVLSLRTR